MIVLLVDFFVLIIFIGLIKLRKQKNWESLFNDYELKESLKQEVQEQYWKKATKLDQRLFVWIFLMMQAPLLGMIQDPWICIIFMIIGFILIMIWYGIKWTQLKNEFQVKDVKKS